MVKTLGAIRLNSSAAKQSRRHDYGQKVGSEIDVMVVTSQVYNKKHRYDKEAFYLHFVWRVVGVRERT
jgi:hypothetical protein